MYYGWSTLKKLIYLHPQLGGTPSESVTVTGISPLVLESALKKALQSLIQSGIVEQDGTPAPSSPADIVCNNGKLVMVDDELPAGYKRVLGFRCDNNAMWEFTDFHLRGSDTVRISFSINAACNVWGCYQGTSATDNYDLYASVSSGSKYLRYSDGTYLSYWSNADLGQRFDTVVSPTGTSGMPQDSTWTPKTFESANNFIVGSTTLTGTSAKLKGDLYENVVVDGRLKAIPCERVSDNVLGYYDTYTSTFVEPYAGYTGAVSLGYDGSHLHFAVVGTDEVITVSPTGTTADAVDLYAVGSYADTQDIISGAISRKVGIKVLNGAETWTLATNNDASGNKCYYTPFNDRAGGVSNLTLLCTHYAQAPAASYTTLTADKFLYNPNASNKNVYFDGGAITTKDAWTAWLKAQYDAGTPVMVLYPLDTPTTSSTTPQPITLAAGTNTITATAEVSNIPLEATYIKAI